jgi:hypothetical protein
MTVPLRRAAAELRSAIDALSIDAQVLLVRAQHESMKEHVRNAQRDLTSALILLDQHTRSAIPALLLGVVDASIKAAKLRLEMVESALRNNGPDSSDF